MLGTADLPQHCDFYFNLIRGYNAILPRVHPPFDLESYEALSSPLQSLLDPQTLRGIPTGDDIIILYEPQAPLPWKFNKHPKPKTYSTWVSG